MAASSTELTTLNGAYTVTFNSDEIGDTAEGVTIRRIEEKEPVVTDSKGTADYIISDVLAEVEMEVVNWNMDAQAVLLDSTHRVQLTGAGAEALIKVGLEHCAEIGKKYSTLAAELTLTPVSGAATPKYKFPKAVFDGMFEVPHSGRKDTRIGVKFIILRDANEILYQYGKVV